MRLIPTCLFALLMFCQAATAAEVRVGQPWVKGTLVSMRTTTAHMEIACDEDAAIIAARSPLAERVALRDMLFEASGELLRPVEVKEIPLPARQTVALTPVTWHLLLQGLKAPLSAGQHVPLVLTVRTRSGATQEVQVEAPVRALAR